MICCQGLELIQKQYEKREFLINYQPVELDVGMGA